MGMTKKEIQALDAASLEFFKDGKIKTTCPRCGKPIKVHVKGNSYRVACVTKNCIEDVFRGI